MPSPCNPAVTVASSTTTLVVNGGAPSIIVASGPPIVLELHSSDICVEAPGAPALIIEVCKQGPAGPPGGALPPATEEGQVLFSKDGLVFTVEQPIVSSDGWLANDDDKLLVEGL